MGGEGVQCLMPKAQDAPKFLLSRAKNSGDSSVFDEMMMMGEILHPLQRNLNLLELVYSEAKGANVVKATTKLSSGPAVVNEVDISWRREKKG